MLAGAVSPEDSLLGLQLAAFSLHLSVVCPLHVHISALTSFFFNEDTRVLCVFPLSRAALMVLVRREGSFPFVEAFEASPEDWEVWTGRHGKKAIMAGRATKPRFGGGKLSVHVGTISCRAKSQWWKLISVSEP